MPSLLYRPFVKEDINTNYSNVGGGEPEVEDQSVDYIDPRRYRNSLHPSLLEDGPIAAC